MRHFCEDKHSLKSFGWKEHNGTDFGRQELLENDLKLETSFVKPNEGSLGYGGDWAVRINVENLAWYELLLGQLCIYAFHLLSILTSFFFHS